MNVAKFGDLVEWPPIFVIPGPGLDARAARDGVFTAIAAIAGSERMLRGEVAWKATSYSCSIKCKDATLPVARIAELLRGHLLGQKLGAITASDKITFD